MANDENKKEDRSKRRKNLQKAVGYKKVKPLGTKEIEAQTGIPVPKKAKSE